MMDLEVPEIVRNKALAAGAAAWLDGLPALVADLEREWGIRVGHPYAGGTEAFVAEATRADGTAAVLKLLVPRAGNAAGNEITVLRLLNGEGCVRLLRDDSSRGALLLERLGTAMSELAFPIAQRNEILCALAQRVWRPAPDCGLPTGAEKGRWLELLGGGDARERARGLARRTGLDAGALWEWGVVERVSTGLLCTKIELQPVGRKMLAVAEHVSTEDRSTGAPSANR